MRLSDHKVDDTKLAEARHRQREEWNRTLDITVLDAEVPVYSPPLLGLEWLQARLGPISKQAKTSGRTQPRQSSRTKIEDQKSVPQ